PKAGFGRTRSVLAADSRNTDPRLWGAGHRPHERRRTPPSRVQRRRAGVAGDRAVRGTGSAGTPARTAHEGDPLRRRGRGDGTEGCGREAAGFDGLTRTISP